MQAERKCKNNCATGDTIIYIYIYIYMLDHSISIAQQHPGTKRMRNLVQSELPRFMWTNNQQPTTLPLWTCVTGMCMTYIASCICRSLPV